MEHGYVSLFLGINKQAGKRRIPEHRFIMDAIMDGTLKKEEVVHHINKDRADNSVNNLMVLSRPCHGKLHAWEDKNAY